MTTADIIPHLPSFLPPKRGFTFVVRARPTPNLLAEPRRPMALCRVRFGLCFGLGLASFAANTRQTSGEKAGGDIDFAAFYILPVPSSLSAKWRRVKIGSLPSFSPSLRMPPKHTLRVRDHRLGATFPIRRLPPSTARRAPRQIRRQHRFGSFILQCLMPNRISQSPATVVIYCGNQV